ncbi:MAG: hypothetical protein HY287_03805 [Planctomycetes bacterium]|nr:hypothetical protein [Planctomycetota bacterium]MBI3833437.1 hypothetical protein [Planctomycetota bacterium]
MEITRIGIIGVALLLAASTSGLAAPMSTAFTFQGQLKQDGHPFDGNANLTFQLFDAVSGGNILGTINLPATVVTKGLFSADLDFGPGPFTNAEARWLEIQVDGTSLSPRELLTATPFSLATRGINVDDSGNVGIGMASPLENLDVNGNIRAAREDGAETQLIVESRSATGPPHLTMRKERGSLAAPTPVPAGDQLGEINFNGWDGNRWFAAAGISASAVQDFTSTWHPSSLEFATTSGSGGGRQTQMVINEDGDVGIGTTSPAGHLHIFGGPHWTSHGWNKCLALSGNGSIELGQDNPNTRFGIASSNDQLYVFSSTTDGTEQPPSYRMIIDENGDVGIGTTGPQAKLEVASGEVRFPGGTNPGGSYTNFNDSQDGKNHIRGTTIMADNGGNVGIGTTNPQAKLDVGGGILASGEIRSTSGGFRFPNGTVQSTAGVTSAISSINGQSGPNITLKGSAGTTVSQADNVITIAAPPPMNGGITSINGQSGPAVTLVAGNNVSITPLNNQITISATGSGAPSGIQRLKTPANPAGTTGPDVVIQGSGNIHVDLTGNIFTISAPVVVCTWNGRTYTTGAECLAQNTCQVNDTGLHLRIATCGSNGSWSYSDRVCGQPPAACGP